MGKNWGPKGKSERGKKKRKEKKRRDCSGLGLSISYSIQYRMSTFYFSHL
jgi:hypothetical protein